MSWRIDSGWVEAPFSDLVGLTISEIAGMEQDSEVVTIKTACGRTFRMKHYDDCCESVSVNDVCGSVDGLIGVPVLYAEESVSENEGEKPQDWSESWTWTFYRIGTINGTVVLRWLGESNGYYSESVDFEEAREGER